MSAEVIIDLQHVKTQFGTRYVHKDVTFSMCRGEVIAIIGSSGCGKSTLLREIIGLLRPSGGQIKVFGSDVWSLDEDEFRALNRRFGVLFQRGALFSALTAGENVAAPLMEMTDLDENSILNLVQLRLGLTGLDPSVAQLMPSELSGGMIKRVALARALALEPEILFLDEPTSGLDPIGARAFDVLIKTLNNSLQLTTVMVTHDIDSIRMTADRLVVLDEGVVLANGTVEEVERADHPWIQKYFSARSDDMKDSH